MSVIILKSFCLPFKKSHFPFVALQAAAGMGLSRPRTVYCIALTDAPSLVILNSFCLPIKISHFPFVALQAAAGMGVFGPRTVYCIALKDAPGCHEFLLQDDGKWVHVKETTEIGQ